MRQPDAAVGGGQYEGAIVKRRAAHAVIVGLVLIAAACSGGSSSAPTTSSPTSEVAVPSPTTTGLSTTAPPATTAPSSSPQTGKPDTNATGRHDLDMVVDNSLRRYIVQVPESYNGDPMPMVIFLHGGNGTGEGAWKSSGWKELGEREGVVTVFPTAWSHCWTNSFGVQSEGGVWHGYPGTPILCDGEKPRDDVAFLSGIIDEATRLLSIDQKRVYVVGFSSGGEMAFRVAVELGNKVAAVVQVAGTNTHSNVGTSPARTMPIAFEVGTDDQSWMQDQTGAPLDDLEYLMFNHPPFGLTIAAHLDIFGYDPAHELVTRDGSFASAVRHSPDDVNAQFVFSLIEGLDHHYPNGVNHPMKGAERHWKWLSQFELP